MKNHLNPRCIAAALYNLPKSITNSPGDSKDADLNSHSINRVELIEMEWNEMRYDGEGGGGNESV